jgi:hypothetical protein
MHRSRDRLAYASARREIPALVSAAEAYFGSWSSDGPLALRGFQEGLESPRILVEITPFGISDLFTHKRERLRWRRRVLNAFRHLRSIHFREDRALVGGVVVLNAFGISDPFTRDKPHRNAAPVPVLNAFRHLISIHV